MQSRLKRLKRMAVLYAVVERMHSAELQRATGAVREAELAIEAQRTIVRTAANDERLALVNGDRLGWSLGETHREMAVWKGGRLEDIRLKREEQSEVVRERYAMSRLKSEQMNCVVESVAAQVEREEARRAQSEADDRFLSRKLWIETGEVARKAQMNAS
jgi:hypothetical protein